MNTVFDQPGMYIMVAIVSLIEVLSLALMIALLLAYRSARRGQRRFFAELYNVESEDVSCPAPALRRIWAARPLLIWAYIISTVVMTIVSGLIFIFQPHVI